MKSIFVVLPLGIENALEVASSIALAVSTKLGEYLFILPDVHFSPFSFGTFFEKAPFEGKNRDGVSFLARAIEYMAQADYIAFPPDWRKHKECQLLRAIAEAYGLNVIETAEEQETELKPCPFCGSEAVMQKPTTGCYFVECVNNCVVTHPYDTVHGAAEAWNNRTEG